ncbi:hypothetical protein [Pseudoxanthomonas winnipegensis]|uniref:hypothetical protein n=1 Tax=Pseudoxanthomonas winnipegensis TaxID=2480810 RepID=UPI0030F49EFC
MKVLLRPILATVVYVGILLLTNFIHMRFFDVNVVLYSSIVDALLAVLVTLALFRVWRLLDGLSRLEFTQLLVIWCLLGYVFAISVPTVLDRSLSFYILEKLQQRGGGILENRIGDVFVHEYMKEHRLVDIRLTEQVQSGTVEIKHGCVLLTAKGRDIASISRFYRAHFLPRNRLIMNAYTDDLVDPFRKSAESVDYTCQ